MNKPRAAPPTSTMPTANSQDWPVRTRERNSSGSSAYSQGSAARTCRAARMIPDKSTSVREVMVGDRSVLGRGSVANTLVGELRFVPPGPVIRGRPPAQFVTERVEVAVAWHLD